MEKTFRLMTSKVKKLRFFGMTVLLASIFLYIFQILEIRVNLTASMPIGLYLKRHSISIQRGDLVLFCLPKAIAVMGVMRGYLGSGSCPGHSMPLLKEVIALPGDHIVLSQSFINVNWYVYFAPQQTVDSDCQLVMHWIKNGTYHVTNKIWVYGSHDPTHSWDSRYFGGIPVKNILGVYKPLWVIK